MKDKKTTKIVLIIASILLVITASITATQAYFNKDTYAKNPIEYQSGILSVDAKSKSNNISLDNTLPMSDEDGIKTEPYVFTIKNNGNVDYKFSVRLLSTSDNTIYPEYIKLQIDELEAIKLSELTDSIIKKDIILSAGETIDITLRVWLDIDTPNTQIGKEFNSKIVIDGQSVYTNDNMVIYDANGGTGAPGPQVIKRGEQYISNTIPNRDGYTFLGWGDSKTSTTVLYNPGDKFIILKSTTLYAIWDKSEYTVTFTILGQYEDSAKVKRGENLRTEIYMGITDPKISCTNGAIGEIISLGVVSVTNITSDTTCNIYN